MTQMEQLINDYDFNSITEFYDYCLDSYINGNKKQSRELFYMMPKGNQKDCIMYLTVNYGQTAQVFEFTLNLFD
jgi:hypothetical protein